MIWYDLLLMVICTVAVESKACTSDYFLSVFLINVHITFREVITDLQKNFIVLFSSLRAKNKNIILCRQNYELCQKNIYFN